MDRHEDPQTLRPGGGEIAYIRLDDQVSRLRDRLQSSPEDRQAASLVKLRGLNVMLIALKKGAYLHEHHTKGPITVHVISGLVDLIAANKPNEITAGRILALDRDVAHSVKALEESMLLLTTALV
jgi:quercetin dioxygenase-like cupin family protein